MLRKRPLEIHQVDVAEFLLACEAMSNQLNDPPLRVGMRRENRAPEN